MFPRAFLEWFAESTERPRGLLQPNAFGSCVNTCVRQRARRLALGLILEHAAEMDRALHEVGARDPERERSGPRRAQIDVRGAQHPALGLAQGDVERGELVGLTGAPSHRALS